MLNRLGRKRRNSSSAARSGGGMNAVGINPFALPTLFTPLDEKTTPQELFPSRLTPLPQHCRAGSCSGGLVGGTFPRFVCTLDPHAALVYTDGACIDNGGKNPRGGYGFVFRGPEPIPSTGLPIHGSVSMRLEDRGPSGEMHVATNNRAELRAVLAVLQFRHWPGENIHRLVIATDSEYVALSSTRWLRKWLVNGWHNNKGDDVQNKDLWMALWERFQYWHEHGLAVLFWRIPREQNTAADAAANKGVGKDEESHFCELRGAMV